MLKAGEERSFEITGKGFRLSVSNAGSVSVKINGEEIPPLGSSGEVVRNIIVSKDTIKELKKETKQDSTQ